MSCSIPHILLAALIAIACVTPACADHEVSAQHQLPARPDFERYLGRNLLDKVKRGNTRTLLVFGDSISDNGVLWRRLQKVSPISPPYFRGRFCNGPVLVEYLADKLGLKLVDLAEGGATACEVFKRGDFTFTNTVEAVVNRTVSTPPVGFNWKKTSVFFLAGTNDILTLLQQPSLAPTFAATVAGCIASSTEKVLSLGVKKVFWAKVGPAHLTPRLNAAGPQATALAKLAEAGINAALPVAAAAVQQRYPDARIQVVDIYDLFTNIYDNPTKYDLTDARTPCLRCSNTSAPGETQCFTTATQSLLNACTNAREAKKRMWWDTIHFTTVVHQKLAKSIFSQLTVKGALFGK